MTIITTKTDLRNWVWERLHDADEAEIVATVDAIAGHPERPHYGDDWTEFFQSLPDNLCELVAS